MNDDVEEIEYVTILKKIRYKGIVWVPYNVKENKFIGNVKLPYIVKYVKSKKVGDVFVLDDFFKLYPNLGKDKSTRCKIDKALSVLIRDKCIIQVGNEKFKVL